MRLRTVALSEGLVAQDAPVGSLPVVGPHVDPQVHLAGAGLPADPADKRLAAEVDPQVVVQVGLALEGPAAVGAAVRYSMICFPLHLS